MFDSTNEYLIALTDIGWETVNSQKNLSELTI